MDNLKENFKTLSQEINDNDLEGNEFYLYKEEKLKNYFKDFDNEKLFKFMFLKDMKDVDIDDKIVIIYNVIRYDKKEFKKANKKMSLVEGESQENNINDFKSIIFSTIKTIVLKGLDIAKELIKSQFDIFFEQASGALGQFLKENGLKLLEIIIDKVREGIPAQDVKVKIDNKKMALCDILNSDECEQIDKLADKVDEIYDKTYKDIQIRVDEAKNGEKVEDFVIDIDTNVQINNKGCCIIL